MKYMCGFWHLIRATGNSFCGIKDAFQSSYAFRHEIIIGIVQFIAMVFIRECIWINIWLISLWVLLMIVELINSAIESVVDLVSPEWNVLAKHAKDYSSAAVFLLVLLFVVNWVFVVVRQFYR